MISTLQIIVILFVLFAASRAFLRLKGKQISLGEFLFWMGVWAAVVIVMFVPKITNDLARVLGIGRGIDIAVYFSIILIFYLIFRVYVKLDQAEQEITKLVRIVTIQDAKKKK